MVVSTIFGFLAGFVSGALGFTGAVAMGVCTLIGYVGAIAVYGGVALSITSKNNKKMSFGDLSSTYSSGVISTQTNQDLPIPLLYGTVKLAGNRIWQSEDNTSSVKRLVAFAEGEITEFSDIRLNDIKSNEISGIKINKYYGTYDQIIDPIVGGNTQEERAEKVGSLKNLAYLAISVPRSQKIDINYNLTCIVKGRKVRVYTTPFKYEVKYSENPAWAMFDFLTCYNGLGLAIGNDGKINEDAIKELFDIESFIESAKYCDELVNGKPRFTFNMIFDAQTSARSLIDEVFRSCRGGLFLKEGKLQFKIDKPEPVSKYIKGEDIIKGSETFQTIPKEEHYDILKCVYISPEHEWQKVEAFAEIPEYRDGVPIEHSVNIFSVTDFSTASRLSWYYVNSKRLQPYFGSFKTDYRAYDLEVGDVICFDSLLMSLEAYPVKVISVIDDGAGTYTVNWRNYDERLYTDTLGSKEPKVLVSNLIDVSTYPEDVKSFNVVQQQNIFNFVWEPNDLITDTYEIRMGDTWSQGTVIGKNITENKFSAEISTSGLYKFWIKAFNKYNYSKNASLDVISVDSIPSINEIVRYDILDCIEGVFDNTYSYHNSIKLKNDDVIWKTTENFWTEDDYYSTDKIWGVKAANKGSYISQIYDLGDILDCIVIPEYNYMSSDETNDISVKWRYSSDGTIWTEWQIANTGQFKFRYSQYRVDFRSYNNIQLVLTNFCVSIDVPDKELILDVYIDDAENGKLVEYDFLNKPSIIATVNDDISAYAVVKGETKTNKNAVIKAFSNDGQGVKANVNLRIKGY